MKVNYTTLLDEYKQDDNFPSASILWYMPTGNAVCLSAYFDFLLQTGFVLFKSIVVLAERSSC